MLKIKLWVVEKVKRKYEFLLVALCNSWVILDMSVIYSENALAKLDYKINILIL